MAGRAHVGTVSTTGERKIAKSLGFSRTTVEVALRQLVDRKHVAKHPTGKQRNSYNLTSNIFGKVFREGRRVLVKGASGDVMLACEGDSALVSQPRKRA
jgi:DNA-binding transcriptional regulator PaaX